MSIGWVIAMALVASVGAFFALPVPVAVVLGVAAGAVLLGRAAAFVVAVGIVVTGLSSHAWSELDEPLPASIDALATVVRDPERVNGSVRAELSIDGRRYQAWATGEAGHGLASQAVGKRVRVVGSTRPLSGMAVPSLRRRHVAGRLDLESISNVDNGNISATLANTLRGLIHDGANSMSEEDQALFTGLVYGDDREQHDDQQDDFRESGLSHLLAVSGQNVAFLLLLLQPLIRRFHLGGRLAICGAALFVFATVTRWEPSVMRAVVMASVVLLATYSGRPSTQWRTLALAVTASLLIDPFLVGSIGFLMSVGACCGIATLGRPLARRIPGPKLFRSALGFTLAAQVGVAPVQLLVFDSMPGVAAISNLFAEPFAAFVMMWGMTAGLVAGLFGGTIAALIHLPTTIAVSALAWIAGTGADLPIGNWNITCASVVVAILLCLPESQGPHDDELRSARGHVATDLSRQR